jgi:hypothetical protein
LEELEDRTAPTGSQFVDPHPTSVSGDGFGSTVLPLSTGNVVITAPNDDAGGTHAGAVYLFNGATGALLSTLTGSHANDQIGSNGVALSNGNFVIVSPQWNGSLGAVTWGNGTTGISGTVSAANSLVGSSIKEDNGVVPLSNGNYVVANPYWSNGSATNAGEVTWGSGTAGVSGTVSAANSVVGSTTNDFIGNSIVALSNGNYVVDSPYWSNGSVANAGAVTWGNGVAGTTGVVSVANSLVGTTTRDQVGSIQYGLTGVFALANGNYVVGSDDWSNGSAAYAGAATWGNGATGTTGPVSAANSLVGTASDDFVGSAIVPLTNGNYVVDSPFWSNGSATNAGAVTWGNGMTGTSGFVSAVNSLVGTTTGDRVGYFERGKVGVFALANGNFVVGSSNWNNGSAAEAGAATWGNGATGITGSISASNSLVGMTAGDQVGSDVVPLANGNYVVGSWSWHNGSAVAVGTATWGNGAVGITGPVSADNSLFGTTSGDGVGYAIVPLTNGNYVVDSPSWSWSNGSTGAAGAVTWGNGTTGITGPVTVDNSLVGMTAGDRIGYPIVKDPITPGPYTAIVALANGNYVVGSPEWSNGGATEAGAATWGNGAVGTTGVVSAANSLVGTTTGDQLSTIIVPLPNGNYVVCSPWWDNGAAPAAGAATWGNGAVGTTGVVSAANSLVGTINGDEIGFHVRTLTNGNYVISSDWHNGSMAIVNAVTWGSGTGGVSGPVSEVNSLVGTTTSSGPGTPILDNVNGRFLTPIVNQGIVLVGSQTSLPLGPSLVGYARFAVGADANGPATVTVYNPDRSVATTLTPFPNTTGGVRVAEADFNGDGIPDLAVGTGPGAVADVKVYDGATGATLFDIQPFESSFTGGVFVAAGDLTNDGKADLVITPDEGGGPRVRVFSGGTFTQLADFYGIDDPNFRGGARAAVGDINGDGTGDLIVAAGVGGGPRVAVFDGKSVGSAPVKLFPDFFLFEPTLRSGLFVAAGDLNGDGFADFIAGAGPGGGPRVLALSGKDLMSGTKTPLANFFVSDPNNRGGVRVAVKELDGDGQADLVVGAGTGSKVTAYLGKNVAANGTPPEQFGFDAYPGYTGGVFVG